MDSIRKIFKTRIVILVISVLTVHGLCAQQKKNDGTITKNAGSTEHPVPNNSIFHGTLADLNWLDVKKAAEENAIVILPVGVIEQHGPHMCLGTDTYLAYHRSLELKQQLDSAGIKSVIAPPFYWGIMQLNESGAFPGSFTVSPSTMKALLADIFADLHRWGFRYVYCFNHHGDRLHRKTLSEAIAEAKEKPGLVFYNDQEQQDRGNGPDFMKYATGKMYEPNYHAGTAETSLMLEYYPKLVNLEIAKTLQPESRWQPLGYVGDPANYKNINMREYSKAEVNYLASCIIDWIKVKNKIEN